MQESLDGADGWNKKGDTHENLSRLLSPLLRFNGIGHRVQIKGA